MLLFCPGYNSECIVDSWPSILWTCQVQFHIIREFCIIAVHYRTTLLWDYSEVAMAAVFSMLLSCGSHSKV